MSDFVGREDDVQGVTRGPLDLDVPAVAVDVDLVVPAPSQHGLLDAALRLGPRVGPVSPQSRPGTRARGSDLPRCPGRLAMARRCPGRHGTVHQGANARASTSPSAVTTTYRSAGRRRYLARKASRPSAHRSDIGAGHLGAVTSSRHATRAASPAGRPQGEIACLATATDSSGGREPGAVGDSPRKSADRAAASPGPRTSTRRIPGALLRSVEAGDGESSATS